MRGGGGSRGRNERRNLQLGDDPSLPVKYQKRGPVNGTGGEPGMAVRQGQKQSRFPVGRPGRDIPDPSFFPGDDDVPATQGTPEFTSHAFRAIRCLQTSPTPPGSDGAG